MMQSYWQQPRNQSLVMQIYTDSNVYDGTQCHIQYLTNFSCMKMHERKTC